MISNYDDIFATVEPRIKSSLDTEEIKFKGYSLQEMKNILKKRCEDVFRLGVVQEGVVLLCANHAVNRGGDVRVGLECLRRAAKVCEDQGDDKLRVEHVKKILSDVKSVKLQIMQDRVEGIDKNIVELLKGGKKIIFTEFEKEYNKNYEPLSDASLRKHVEYLESVGLVKTEENRRGSQGRKCYLSLVKRKRFKR